ncbi:hypothetical protein Hanom_Chr12g01124731 [Helianthus anomalus]
MVELRKSVIYRSVSPMILVPIVYMGTGNRYITDFNCISKHKLRKSGNGFLWLPKRKKY